MMKKLQELILYIAHKSHDDPSFSVTKLNKILFIADFNAYGLLGEPITGATYIHRQFGPVPREMPDILDLLTKSGKVEIKEKQYFGHLQKRIVPLENADLKQFTTDQISLLGDVIHECRTLTASRTSKWTHTLVPWLDSSYGEVIPYETVFILADVPPSKADIDWAKQKISELRPPINA
jgi:uncharacterized phage-associated protein